MMARPGRKRKQGRRTPTGHLSRAGKPAVTYDQGTDRTRAKFSLYGADGSDAIGRAYVAGLLGDDALNLRNAARSIARAYWPMLTVGRYQCAIADKTGGAANDDPETNERIARREQWLTGTLRMIDNMGRDIRRSFDELVININPDEGPLWLDNLITSRKTGHDPCERDMAKLAQALEPLQAIAKGR